MNKLKIINDPIYGLIRIPFGLIYDLIEHPLFQRLRRIKQMGLSYYVYPGAVHTRFSHALGAMHLTWQTILALRLKGVEISDDEAMAVLGAILLHDIGHGPFSHSLERVFVPVSHEEISLAYMEIINEEMDGALDMAISMFVGEYPRRFFHQLISSQLDMDRLDYLNRDSFFSGVIEGKVGFDRIINMLNVVNEQLVIEEKGVYSVEKYLSSRSFMYWQVYLHRVSLAAELMLGLVMKELKTSDISLPGGLRYFMGKGNDRVWYEGNKESILTEYASLDDSDVMMSLKLMCDSDKIIINKLSNGLLNRKLFKLVFKKNEISSDFSKSYRQKVVDLWKVEKDVARKLVMEGKETVPTYIFDRDEILVLKRNGEMTNLSKMLPNRLERNASIYYLCGPIV